MSLLDKNQVLAIHHDNWLKQDLTQYHLKELEKFRIVLMEDAAKASTNYTADKNVRANLILSKLVRANTIKEIIEYVKTNQYPS